MKSLGISRIGACHLSEAILLGAVALLASHPAWADQLADVKARGSLICGTLGTVPPFSFQNATTRATAGYDVDICEIIAKSIGVKAEIKLVAASARIPELSEGRIDVVTATLGWTPERAKQVDYSYSYYSTRTVLGVRNDSGLSKWDQFAGKRIAAQSASTSAQAVRDKLPQTTLVTFEDVPQALLALRQRKADAIALSEVLLQRYKVQMQGTDDAVTLIVDPPLFVEHYGVGVKKGEAALLDQVNSALTKADKSGEIDRDFEKWLGPASEYKLTRAFKVQPISGN